MDVGFGLKSERDRQRATERLRELAMQNDRFDEERESNWPFERVVGRETVRDSGGYRERENGVVMSRVTGEREARGSGERAGDKVENLIASHAMLEGEREGKIGEVDKDGGRGLKRLRGVVDQLSEERDAGRDRKERDESAMAALQELVSQYKSALAELTFNSKPIITNLTIIAGENAQAAHGITATICAHILEVPKEQKLPSLYLLDSIVKNIGGEYVKYFAARLPEVFCKAYKQVDPTTYQAMQHLFRTWRGVFPSGPLRTIETELQFNPQSNGPPTATPASRLVESPSPRTGHGIHVNPKYLEAHGQFLQQTTKSRADGGVAESNGDLRLRDAERSLLRESPKGRSGVQLKRPPVVQHGQRDRFGEPGYSRESSYEYPDYEYGRRGGPRPDIGTGRGAERNEQWEHGRFYRDGDMGRGFGATDDRQFGGGAYTRRNGYDLRQRAGPRGLGTDGHGYNRVRGRGIPFPPTQPVDLDDRARGGDGRGLMLESHSRGSGLGIDSRTRGALGNWQNVEEEEYVWEDMKPQAREQERVTGDGLRMDSWYAGDLESGRPSSASGRGRMPGVDPSGALEGLSWQRPGGSPQLDQFSSPADDRLPTRRVSVPNRNISLATSNLPPRSGTPPIPSPSGGGSAAGPGGPFGARSNSNLGPSSYNNLSPVTPSSNLPFSQHQPERQPPLGALHPPQQSQHETHHNMQVLIQPLQQESTSQLPSSQSMPTLSSQSSALPQAQQSSQVGSLPHVGTAQLYGQPLSAGSIQQSQTQQFPQQTQQVVPLAQQGQLSHFLQQPEAHQQQAQPVLGTLANGQSEVQTTDTTALVAFLKSGLLPGVQNQMQPQPQRLSPQRSSVPVPQQALPTQPPPQALLPAPFVNPSFLQPGGLVGQYPAAPGQGPSVLPSYPSQQPSRLMQPPLPRGPPPQSTIVAISASHLTPSIAPLPAPMSQIDSLLKSLMAQGLISAPALPAPSSAPAPNNGLQPGASAATVNPGFFTAPPLQPLPNVPSISISAALVSTIAALSGSAVTLADAAAVSSQLVKPQDDLIGTEFKQEILKERHESVIKALYNDFPRQCLTCGLRFKEQEAHSKHMDWHVSRNRRQKSQKKVSRKWFVTVKEWLSGTGASTTEVTPSFFATEVGAMPSRADESENVAVPADESQSACALCGEPFEDFYSDEKDEWMYKGAVYMNVPPGGVTEGMDSMELGPIVHAKCQTESAAIAVAASTEDDEEVQPELLAADSVRMEVDGRGGDDIVPLLDNFDSFDAEEETDDMGSRRKRIRY